MHRLSGLVVVIFVFLIFLFLLRDSLSLFREYPVRKFLFGTQWLPISYPPQFGVVPLLLGSIYVTAWAIFICVPLGVASAMFIGGRPQPPGHVRKSLVRSRRDSQRGAGFLGPSGWARCVTRSLADGMWADGQPCSPSWRATIISISEDALTDAPRIIASRLRLGRDAR
jgi:phosphate transport system permease protein